MEATGTGTLSPKSCDLVKALLKENKILEKVTSDFKHRDYYNIEIITENGRMRFGKYSWGGFGGFWNNLIKCYEQISFADFVLKTWDALVEMTVGTNANEAVIEGLSREILLTGIHRKEYNQIIDRLFDVCRHLTTEGYWKTEGSKPNLNSEPKVTTTQRMGCPYSNGVEIEIERPKQPAVQFYVVDSIGEPFEVLNARWIGGRRKA